MNEINNLHDKARLGPSSTTLSTRLENALRKAYARDDRRFHGVPNATVQALVALELAEIVPRGRYQRHVLSPKGEALAAELTRSLLAKHGDAAPTKEAEASSDSASIDEPRSAWHRRLAEFLSGVDPQATTLTLELPAIGAQARQRIRVERCGPCKFLVQISKPR